MNQGHGDALAQLARRVEDIAGRAAGFDALPLSAGLARLNLLSELEAACQAADNGPARLTLSLEMLVRPGPDDDAGTPVQQHVLSLIERDGWQVQQQEDLTTALLAARQHLMAACRLHRRALERDGHDVASALLQLQQRQLGLQQGRRIGCRLELQQLQRPVQRVVDVTPTRSTAMRALFEQVFSHQMTPEHWQWKYAGGWGQAVALVEDGRVVAHYGGLTRELRAFGQPLSGCQVCDVMVLPTARPSLARQGPMYRVAASFLETQIGWALPHAVGFGFPNARALGAAQRLNLYAPVDRVVQFSWPAEVSAASRDLPLRDIPGFVGRAGQRWRRTADRLWQAMAGDLLDVVVGVRDSRWLQWRYIERPGISYRVVLVCGRWLRRPLGVLVLRQRDDALELIDWVGRPRHWSTLLAVARSLAAAAGLPELRGWITASQLSRFAGLAEHGPRVTDLNIVVPGCSHTPGPDLSLFKDRWFLMCGDADFT